MVLHMCALKNKHSCLFLWKQLSKNFLFFPFRGNSFVSIFGRVELHQTCCLQFSSADQLPEGVSFWR